jgi:hypothetical protein
VHPGLLHRIPSDHLRIFDEIATMPVHPANLIGRGPKSKVRIPEQGEKEDGAERLPAGEDGYGMPPDHTGWRLMIGHTISWRCRTGGFGVCLLMSIPAMVVCQAPD